MTLGQKQRKFAHMVALLILHAEQLGYEVTLGDAFRGPNVKRGLKNSLHRLKLAIDLNLFRDGRYLKSTQAHKPLGLYWESIGGTWGGHFDDGNHYSLKHKGVR